MFKTIVKAIVATVIFVAYSIFKGAYVPVLTNQVALSQFEDSNSSFTDLAQYNILMNYLGVFLFVLCVLLFIPEIKKIIKFAKEKIKEVN